jgi:hypothetical protein
MSTAEPRDYLFMSTAEPRDYQQHTSAYVNIHQHRALQELRESRVSTSFVHEQNIFEKRCAEKAEFQPLFTLAKHSSHADSLFFPREHGVVVSLVGFLRS